MSEVDVKPVVAEALIEEVENFESKALNHVEITEKTLLPSKEGKFKCLNN